MATIDEALFPYRLLRNGLRSDLQNFESGRWYIGEIRDGKRIDQTKQKISEINDRIARLDRVIAAYEAKQRGP